MSHDHYQIRQLAEEIQPPDAGKQSIIVADVENAKVDMLSVSLQ